MISRRHFIISSLLAATASRRLLSSDAPAGFGRVFDPVTGRTLGKITIRFHRVGPKKHFVFRTKPDGLYNFDEARLHSDKPELYKIIVKPGKKNYARLETYAWLGRHARKDWTGDIGLMRTFSPAKSAGLTAAVYNKNWFNLLETMHFGQDRDAENRNRQTRPGALQRFSRRELSLKITSDLSLEESQFLATEIRRSVEFYSGGFNTIAREDLVKPGGIPLHDSNLRPMNIFVEKNPTFPRPAVRRRFADTRRSPGNPNEVIAGRLIIDEYTLVELSKGLQGDLEALSRAETMVQRSVAELFGWSPTVILPGISVMDENYGPGGLQEFEQNSHYDYALSLMASGGGSGCYPPGIRFVNNKNKVILKSDVDWPLNARI